MEDAEIDVAELVFDEINSDHIARHDVRESDIREVLQNAPQFFVNPPRSERIASHLMLGPNRAGRFLLTAITEIEPRSWRPITAYWFHSRLARRFYRESTENEHG